MTPLAIPFPKDTVSSGEAIDDISYLDPFDGIFGLTEGDIARALRQVSPTNQAFVDSHLSIIRQKLNRYRPTPTSSVMLYNTTAALDYLEVRHPRLLHVTDTRHSAEGEVGRIPKYQGRWAHVLDRSRAGITRSVR